MRAVGVAATAPACAPACRARLLHRARALDAFPKTYEDFVERTRAGGLVSVVSIAAICALTAVDALAFTLEPPREVVSMDVDTTGAASGGRMRVRFDVDFPATPCAALALDVTDAFGERQRGVHRAAVAAPLPPLPGVADAGAPLPERCGPCLLSPPPPGSGGGDDERNGPCCGSCEEVRAAQHARGIIGGWRAAPQCRAARSDGAPEAPATRTHARVSGGCRAHGFVAVERAAGQLRFSAAGGAAGAVARVWEPPNAVAPARTANVGHVMRSLAFEPGGDAAARGGARQNDGRIGGALDCVAFTDEGGGADISRTYLVTIVPTRRVHAGGRKGLAGASAGNEFSFTEHTEPAAGAHGGRRAWAGVTLAFELSPIAVVTSVQPRLLLDLLASVTAIVGGGVTIAMLVDACVHSLRDAVDARAPRLERWGAKLHAR